MGNRGLTDTAQLAFAAREGRCLVTGNVRYFVRLGQDAIRDDRPMRESSSARPVLPTAVQGDLLERSSGSLGTTPAVSARTM